jgi:radical SAM protein with 4Fe4S-binding SPASM domain
MKGTKELRFAEWRQIFDDAIDAGMIFASLSGGECLTHPDFDEIYLYLKSKGIIITVLTNGVLLESKLELFKNSPPSFIQVSVYGEDEETYEYVTGSRKCVVVRNAIAHAIEVGLSVGISVTCSKYMKKIDKIVECYKAKGIGVAVNRWLMPPYDSTGRKLGDFNLSIDENILLSKELLYASSGQVPIPYKGKLPLPNEEEIDNPPKGLKCAAGRSDFSINWKGEMSMCVALNKVTGYPLRDSFIKAWDLTNQAAKSFQLPVECFKCIYKKVCNHCPAQHLIDAKYGHCSKLVCNETVKMVAFGLEKL